MYVQREREESAPLKFNLSKPYQENRKHTRSHKRTHARMPPPPTHTHTHTRALTIYDVYNILPYITPFIYINTNYLYRKKGAYSVRTLNRSFTVYLTLVKINV